MKWQQIFLRWERGCHKSSEGGVEVTIVDDGKSCSSSSPPLPSLLELPFDDPDPDWPFPELPFSLPPWLPPAPLLRLEKDPVVSDSDWENSSDPEKEGDCPLPVPSSLPGDWPSP